MSARSFGPAREPEHDPDGSDTQSIELAGAAGDELSRGEEPERGAEGSGGVENESAVAAGPAGESRRVVP